VNVGSRHPSDEQISIKKTVTVRVRFADLHSVTRSVTLDAPISATAILAEIAEELVRTVLATGPVPS
jgi:DNA polymerase-4